jgi:hypothetical protein
MIMFLNVTIAVISMTTTLQTNTESTKSAPRQLYTQTGYPFGMLADRAERIEVIYKIKNSDTVQCRTITFANTQEWPSELVEVPMKKFDLDPLKSCLARVQAKQILKELFNQK